jgi:sensor domain CHASE-containing protein
LQRGIERALSATYAIAALVHQGGGFVNDFNGVATQMLPFYPGIAAIGLSPGGVICCVVPRAGNENSIGFNQLEDIVQNKEARRAATHAAHAGGAGATGTGWPGVVGRLPIYLGQGDTQVFWGFSYVTLRFPQALNRPGWRCCAIAAMPTSCGAKP